MLFENVFTDNGYQLVARQRAVIQNHHAQQQQVHVEQQHPDHHPVGLSIKDSMQSCVDALMMIAPIPFAFLVQDSALLRRCFVYALVIQVLFGIALVLCLSEPTFPLWLAHAMALVFGSTLLVASTVQEATLRHPAKFSYN